MASIKHAAFFCLKTNFSRKNTVEPYLPDHLCDCHQAVALAGWSCKQILFWSVQLILLCITVNFSLIKSSLGFFSLSSIIFIRYQQDEFKQLLVVKFILKDAVVFATLVIHCAIAFLLCVCTRLSNRIVLIAKEI